MQNSCMNSKPIDSWHREFPRIAELRDRLQTTEGTFFHVIPSIIQKSSLAREVYQAHESDLAALDDIAWFAFRTKALKRDLKSHGSRGYTDIHSVLCEARGYRYLIEELKRLSR